MKKSLFVVLVFVVSGILFSQTKDELAGLWKATVKAGNKPTTPTYVMLNSDGTYSWGVDNDGKVLDNTTKGKWDLKSENEIKITPDAESGNIMYYVKTGEKYKYEYVEENGVKTKVYMLEMDWYLEKIK